MFQPLSKPGAFSFPKPPLQHTALGGSNKFRPHRKCWGQTCPFQPLACSGINLSLVLSWQLVVLLRTVPKYKSPDILQPDEHSVAFHKDCLWRILVLFGLASLTYFTVSLESNVTMLRTRHARCKIHILWLLWSGQVVHRSQGHEGLSLPPPSAPDLFPFFAKCAQHCWSAVATYFSSLSVCLPCYACLAWQPKKRAVVEYWWLLFTSSNP